MGEPLHQRGWRTAFTVVERVLAWAALVSVIERLPGPDLWWWRRHPRILVKPSDGTRCIPGPHAVEGEPYRRLADKLPTWEATSVGSS